MATAEKSLNLFIMKYIQIKFNIIYILHTLLYERVVRHVVVNFAPWLIKGLLILSFGITMIRIICFAEYILWSYP